MELERELRALAAEIEWPETPPPVPSLTSVVATPRHARWRRHATLALAAVAVALAAAFAVPQSRGAILRVLHLGGATVRFVDRLPAAQERPLGESLGHVVAEAEARSLLAGGLLLPPLDETPPLHAQNGVVSLLFRDRGEPVLLSELAVGGAVVLKKIAGGATTVDPVDVGGAPGLWLSGAEHVLMVPEAPPRLAGNVLLWQRGRLTLRLEGRGLTQARAVELASALR